MEIRPASGGDLESLVSIYNHYVVNSDATFDESRHSVEDRRPWFESFGGGRYRLLVATDNEEVLGYAGSTRHRAHPAFDETVELTAYIAPDHTGRGVGAALYERLIADLASERVHRAVAGIALPNEASVRLHRRFGFTDIGVFDEYACLRDRYVSSLWMQRRF